MNSDAMMADASRTGAAPAWLWLLLALALLPLLATPVLPFIDFYNHVARFHVLDTLGENPVFARNYAAAWAILPNIGLDVVAALLLKFMPLALLPHAVAMLVVLVNLLGVVQLNRAITGAYQVPAALLAVPLAYSWVLNWGFVHFLFGLGLAFLAAAWWLQQRAHPLRRLGVALVLALLVFFCHALAFGLYGILIATLEIGHWWQQRPRRPAAVLQALGLCLAQALVPAWLFLQSRTATAAGGISNADESIARLRAQGQLVDRLQQLLLHRLETLVRVAEGPSFLADILWMLAAAALIGWALWRGALRLAPMVVPVLLAGVLLAVITPPALFGSGYVADRVPLFLAMALVAGLGAGAKGWRVLVPALAALAAVRLAMLAAQWQGTAADLADFDAVARRLPPGQLVYGFGVGANVHEDMPNRCEMYPPLLLLRHGQVVPLFAIRTAQPMELRGPLAAARNRLLAETPASSFRDRPADLIDKAAQSGFSHVLLCRVAADRPFPDTRHDILAQAGRFRLLRLKAEH